VSERDHGNCLTEETLTEYLEGGLDPAVKAASEVHLVSCGNCREQLAFFMRVLAEEVAQDEADALKTITAEWDRRKEGSKTPRRRALFPRIIVAWTAAAVLVAGVVSLWMLRDLRGEPESAAEVTHLLLTQNRPFEARLAGQPHRPIQRTRAAEEVDVSYSVLAGEMTRLSASSYEMGRFYLLQKDFSRAIPYLEIAEKEVGAYGAVHNDLGVAYIESGNLEHLKKAEPEFLHALADDRWSATAVFNLALFYERTNAVAQAAAQWKRYLEMDSKSDWATEVRERLQGISR
jgi:tetratricopeptide (TPR) repeat protein